MKKIYLCLCLIFVMLSLTSCGGTAAEHLLRDCSYDDYTNAYQGNIDVHYQSHNINLAEWQDTFEDAADITFEGRITAFVACEDSPEGDEGYIIEFEKKSDAKLLEKNIDEIFEDRFDKLYCIRKGKIVCVGERAIVERLNENFESLMD